MVETLNIQWASTVKWLKAPDVNSPLEASHTVAAFPPDLELRFWLASTL